MKDDVLEHNECRYKDYCTSNDGGICERGYDLFRYIGCTPFRLISYETKEFKKFEKHIREFNIR